VCDGGDPQHYRNGRITRWRKFLRKIIYYIIIDPHTRGHGAHDSRAEGMRSAIAIPSIDSARIAERIARSYTSA